MRRAAFYAWAVGVLALDQATKAIMLDALGGGREIPVIPGFLVFVLAFNTGAAFGLFQNAAAFLAVVAVAAVIGIVLMERHGNASRLDRFAFALMLGGVLGNLVDRVRLQHVVDFISVQWMGRPIWPVFNLADSALTVGTAIFLVQLLAGKPRHASGEGASDG